MFGGTATAAHGVAAVADTQQMAFYTQCLELLLSAGYFRARLPAVTPFDKVLGGLAWCIAGSNAEVDVDVLFTDHQTMGQKIKVGENVCFALKKMRCPHPLLSHQIRGGDYESIFPVLQWLVKTLLETRSETLEATRRASQHHYSCKTLPQAPLGAAPEALVGVLVLGRPQRKFRRRSGLAPSLSVAERAEQTLAEFGRLPSRRKPQERAGGKELGGQAAARLDKEAAQRDEAARRAEEQRVAALVGGLEAGVDGTSISTQVAGALVGLQSSEISAAAQEYNRREAERQSGGARGADDAHRRTVAALERKIQLLEEQYAKIDAARKAMRTALVERQRRLEEMKARAEGMLAEIEQFDGAETAENSAALQRLRQMIFLNERLKEQEAAFKAACRQQRDELQAKIAELSSADSSDDAERLRALEAELESDLVKMGKLRQLLARKTREAVALQRRVEEIPSRVELVQYERRFVELYDQVSSRLEETRNYYDTYNTLSDTHVYLSKEVSLLNSVIDQFGQTSNNKRAREALLNSVTDIISGVDKMLDKQHAKVGDLRATLDTQTTSYQALVDKERLYFKATKEFQDECRRNEELRGDR